MTNYWTTQTGRIHDCLTIDCVSNGVIAEGSGVIIYATTTADQVTVATAASMGDACGIALKASTATGEPIPVLFFGVFKCILDNGTTTTIAQQAFVMNSGTATNGATCITATGTVTTGKLKLFGGASYVLGMALQDFDADGSIALVLVGKCI